MVKFLHLLLFFATIHLISNCQSIDVRGQFISDDIINKIHTNKPTKEELVQLIGTPTYIPEYSKDSWYYIQRSIAKRAWVSHKVAEQRVVQINFYNDRVSEAILLDNIHNSVLAPNSDLTKAHGVEQSGIQKFVKNIGRFNVTTDAAGKNKKKK